MKVRQGMHLGFLMLGLLVWPVAGFGQPDAAGEGTGQSASDPDSSTPSTGGEAAGQQESGLPAPPAADDDGAATDSGEQDAAPAGDRVQALEQQLRELRESHLLLQREVDVLRSEVRQLSNRLGDLAAPGGATPRNLLGQMAVDEDFRRDVMRAIQGEVVIHNRTASTQPFYVNGVLWSVPPGKYVVHVPFGEVTAHLTDEPPLEFTDHWKLIRDEETGEPRHYRLWLNIGQPTANDPVPATGVVARR